MSDELSWSIVYMGMGYLLSASGILPGLMIAILPPSIQNRTKHVIMRILAYALLFTWLFSAVYVLRAITKSAAEDLSDINFQKTLFGLTVLLTIGLMLYVLKQLAALINDK